MVVAPNFNEAAVKDVFGAVESYCRSMGRFESVNTHEPTNAPQQGLTCAVWIDSIVPILRSGLNSASGSLNFRIRIYIPFRQQPLDAIDADVMTAVSELMGAFIGGFTFSSVTQIQDQIRGVDILGGEGSGERLDARAGYLEMDRKIYRVMTIRLPIVINDMWTEEQ